MDVSRNEVVAIAIEAGREILRIYRSGRLDTAKKSDGSFITRADRAADQIIREALSARWPHPILSEETAQAPWEERESWRRLFVVDPLDGTRDFVRRTGDFTVNIALVEDGRPILGVIAAPYVGITWSAAKGDGAFRMIGAHEKRIENTRGGDQPFAALLSRFHTSDRIYQYLEGRGIQRILRAGSAIKFGRLAEGTGDLYPRYGRTMEWDTAAGDCIATEAGCTVVHAEDRVPLKYNKPDLANPPFMVESPRMPAP
ncbi:MAG: 3'(2'),5'-bisphosphate nucleotidase CysQ [Deltaproteobacteria bacterium]